MSVGICFLIENGNTVDSGFIFRLTFIVFPCPTESQPHLVSNNLGHVCVPC